MYYILYEGLKIDSNEPVYCTIYTYTFINMLLFQYLCYLN